jgi:N-acetylmuramoyl-L-alanine amidase
VPDEFESNAPIGTLTALDHPVRVGDSGPVVRAVRALLVRAATVDPELSLPAPDPALFDAALDQAVRAFQQDRGLIADGIVGRQTALQLDGARWHLGDRTLVLTTSGHLMRGDDVAALQERMVVLGVFAGPVDGIFGPQTEASLRELQRGVGLPPDGICGPPTYEALGALGRSISGGDAWALRSRASVAMAGVSLAGKTIALDPGPDTLSGAGVPGAGLPGAGGVHEGDVTYGVAGLLAEGLRSVGATVVLTRCRDDDRPVTDRVEVAEAAGADLVISFLCDTSSSPLACGVATFYWGGGRVGQYSAIGQRLAVLIQREIVARTDLVDCRSHPSTLDLVRITWMPAVMVSLGYLSNPGDAHRLASESFRRILADAVLIAVQRLYLGEEDAVTGTLNLSDVQALSKR